MAAYKERGKLAEGEAGGIWKSLGGCVGVLSGMAESCLIVRIARLERYYD